MNEEPKVRVRLFGPLEGPIGSPKHDLDMEPVEKPEPTNDVWPYKVRINPHLGPPEPKKE